MAKNRRKHVWLVPTVIVTPIVNFIPGKRCLRGSLYKAIASEAIALGFEPRRNLFFFFFFFNLLIKGLCHGFLASLLTAKIYICVAGTARQTMTYFC